MHCGVRPYLKHSLKTLLLIGLPESEFSMTNFSQLESLQFFWSLKISDLDYRFSVRNTRRSSGYRLRNLLLQNHVQLLSSVPGFTDLIPAQIRELLAGIYSQVYVEYAVKVPTYTVGPTVPVQYHTNKPAPR